jgi:signal transduction histidine kinase
VLQKVQQVFQDCLKERNLTLEIGDLIALPEIEADDELLYRVFYNLVINAIKYTPDGGKITVSGRASVVGEDGWPIDGVEIVVSDTGIGIDPEFHELIFTKFYHTGQVSLHSSGKTKFKGGGPGLGLAIARGIVEAHGGKIWVKSPKHDEGTCPGSQFYVVLPLHQQNYQGTIERPKK